MFLSLCSDVLLVSLVKLFQMCVLRNVKESVVLMGSPINWKGVYLGFGKQQGSTMTLFIFLSVLSRRRLLAHRATVWATAESGIYYYWIQLMPKMAVLSRTERSFCGVN